MKVAAPNDAITVLVVNCGSSTIKYQLFRMPDHQVLSKGLIERIGEVDAALEFQRGGQFQRRSLRVVNHEEGMAEILSTLVGPDGVLPSVNAIDAVGHRVVHGGDEFTDSVLITDQVIASIERFSDLAPLHNPPNLTGIRVARQVLPQVPQVACFDTAFHATMPPVAYLYALPYELYETFGIRRYGFHGTSHHYVARRAAQLLGKLEHETNCITIHLGNGCSITAVRDGQSIDTSMGLTPLEGLMMGTRSGDFDPATLFYLVDHGYDIAELRALCNRRSGLLGVSGESNDLRTLIQKAEAGHHRARLAIDLFSYRVKKYIGMYLAVLGQVDAIVFTGGIGENASTVRASVCRNLDAFGIVIDSVSNRRVVNRREGRISARESQIDVLVIPTDEEAAIAADTYQIVMDIKDTPS